MGGWSTKQKVLGGAALAAAAFSGGAAAGLIPGLAASEAAAAGTAAAGAGAGGAAGAGAAGGAMAAGTGMGGGTAALFNPTVAGMGLLEEAAAVTPAVPQLTSAAGMTEAVSGGAAAPSLSMPSLAGNSAGASLGSQIQGGITNMVGGPENYDKLMRAGERMGKVKNVTDAVSATQQQPPAQGAAAQRPPQQQQGDSKSMSQSMGLIYSTDNPDEMARRKRAWGSGLYG